MKNQVISGEMEADWFDQIRLMMETKFGNNPNGFFKNTNILVLKTLGCAIPFYRNYIATFTLCHSIYYSILST